MRISFLGGRLYSTSVLSRRRRKGVKIYTGNNMDVMEYTMHTRMYIHFELGIQFTFPCADIGT